MSFYYNYCMKNYKLDSENTLVNLGNSILKHFDVEPFHSTLKSADELLSYDKNKKVALILLDGFGKIIYDKYAKDVPYLHSHIYAEFKSVYPPTTVAATTALTSGKYPIETGFLGWTQFFKTKNDYVTVFLSSSAFKEGVTYPSVSENELKTPRLWDYINESGKFKADSIQSFFYKLESGADDFEKFFDEADKKVKENNFVYIYSTNPDHLLHMYGTDDDAIKENVIYLEKKVKTLIENNKDVLFLIVADHGFANIEEINVKEHKDFYETIEDGHFSIEPRFATFFVKKKEKFVELATKYYSDKFDILSKEDLLNNHVFGYGKTNEYALSSIGDYTLIAKSNVGFYQTEEPIGFKGHHAGGTDEELTLNLLGFNYKD